MIFNIYQCLYLIVVIDFPGATAPFFNKVLQIHFAFWVHSQYEVVRICAGQKGSLKCGFFFFVVQMSYHRSLIQKY